VAPTNGWVGVDLRHFVALETVAREASFHRAAAKLGYTQSAVSQQIAALERAVGHKLVERPGGAQPVHLTRAGEIVVEHAHAIGARLSTAQADLRALVAGELSPLRVGFFGHGLGALVPGIFRRLQELDDVDFEIYVSEARRDEELLERLSQGEIDIAFVHEPVAGDGYEHVTLIEDEHVLVVQAEQAEAMKAIAHRLDEIAALPLIGYKASSTCQLADFFRAHALDACWLIQSDDSETIYASVAAGLGVALVPRLGTLSFGAGVQVVDLDCGLPPRRVGLAWSSVRGESGSARLYVEAALAEAATFARQHLSLAS
jgi:DNA-binding transcriptional LysR family regulator